MDYLVKSLAELDAAGSGGLSDDMRNKQVRDYSIEDLAFVIGEGVGLAYLVPVALLNLMAQPFVGEGHLLVCVLEVDDAFWEEHVMYGRSMRRLCQLVKGQVSDAQVGLKVKDRIAELMNRFGRSI